MCRFCCLFVRFCESGGDYLGFNSISTSHGQPCNMSETLVILSCNYGKVVLVYFTNKCVRVDVLHHAFFSSLPYLSERLVSLCEQTAP